MNRAMLFELIYAFAASEGRNDALFGDSMPMAREAFGRGLCGESFPELWLELPLAGEPWFDLHMLYTRSHVKPGDAFSGLFGTYEDALTWFASSYDTRQLALSFDTGVGNASEPAVQLLLDRPNMSTATEFLSTVGVSGMAAAYRSFISRMPKGWYACYMGVFPARDTSSVRVECIVGDDAQRAYAADKNVLAAQLAQMGHAGVEDAFLTYVSELARTPFPLELQFDVGADGTPLSMLAASLRFLPNEWRGGVVSEEVARVFSRVEEWGYVDERWHLLTGTAFAKRISRGDEPTSFGCFPAFIKLRWRDGEPVNAKTYLQALVTHGDTTGREAVGGRG